MRGDPVISVVCGGAREDERFQKINEIILNEGWNGLVVNHLMPLVDKGWRRFILHNPFGLPDVGHMQFDQLLEARNSLDDLPTPQWVKLNRVLDVEEFKRSVRMLVDRGCEVITYFGGLHNDADFADLDAADWIDRAMASIRPALQAGCSIGFDFSVRVKAGSRTSKFISLLVAMGVECYLEPWADADNHELHSLSWIMLRPMLHSVKHRNTHPWPDNASEVEKIIITTQYTTKALYLAGVRAMRAFDPTLTPTVPMWRATKWKLRADEIFQTPN